MSNLLHHNSGIILPRAEYEELTEALATVFQIGAKFMPQLIARLDIEDGEPDYETNLIEDDFTPQPQCIDFGPGCAIADAGEQDDPREENDHAGGNVTDERHDERDEDGV